MVSDAGQLATTPRRRVAVTVTKDSMTASIILREPPVEDPPITVEEILEQSERALAMIELADPKFREELLRAAKVMKVVK